MADTDSLILKVKADIRSLQQGLRQAAKEADIAGKAMQSGISKGGTNRVLDGIAMAASNAGKALAATGAIIGTVSGAFILATNKALDYAGTLARVSDKTGVAIGTLQELKYAAEQSGSNFEELTGGIEKFSIKLGQAKSGGDAAIKSFQSVGLSLAEINADSATESLDKVLRFIASLPSETDRAAAAVEVFGKAGANLALVAGGGAEALDKMRDEARKLGLVLEDSLVRAGDSAGDSIDRLKNIVQAGLMKALLQASPQIEAFVKSLTDNPEELQATINKFVEGAAAIARVGGAAASAAGYVVDFGKWLGESAAKFALANQWIFKTKGALEELNEILAKIGMAPRTRTIVDDLELIEKKVWDVQNTIALRKQYGISTTTAIEELAELEKQAMGTRAKISENLIANLKIPKAELPNVAPDVQTPMLAPGQVNTALKPKKERYIDPVAAAKAAEESAKAASEAEERQYDLSAKVREAQERDLAEIIKGIDADMASAREKEIATQEEEQQALADFKRQIALLGVGDMEMALQAERDHYQDQLSELEFYREQKIELDAGYDEIEAEMAREHGKSMADILAARLTGDLDLTRLAKTKEQALALALGQKALTSFSGQSRKMFELNKALSLGQAVVALPSAIMQSYQNAGGYPFGIAAAAGMALVGAAQIRAISSAKFGGGSSPPVAGAAAAGGGVVGDTNSPSARGQALTLNIPANSIITGRALIDLLNDALRDGGTLVGVSGA